MNDHIYLVDSATKTPSRIEKVGFAEIGVKERADLEQWIISHPELLGERLLIVTDEFHAFDRSNKRLDVLALDKHGILVVVELKLDIAGSHADLQAIRYAAFCSTMTMGDVVAELASNQSVTTDEAEKRILQFLERDELPELEDQPRIILAAGSMDDPEITSCALWLRRFGVGVSCIELTPYRMPDQSTLLVPKIIIPLPETREYTVKVEKKERQKIETSNDNREWDAFWAAVKRHFNALTCPLKVTSTVADQWLVVKGGNDAAHYAWWRMKRERTIRVGIGFRSQNASENDKHMNLFRGDKLQIEGKVGKAIHFQDDWGPFTRRLYVSVPFGEGRPLEEVAKDSAETMAKLVNATLPVLVTAGLHAATSS